MELIKDGYLSPIKVRVCDVSIDLSKVSFSAGDFDSNDTAHAIEPYLQRVAEQIKQYGGKKTLVFLPLIATSQKMTGICQSIGLNARHVDGGSEDRADILRWFKDQERAVLCNAMLLTEGYDEPSIDTIVCLRPTRSRALYTQMVGRGTRLFPGKNHLTILDFLWMTGKHKLVKPTRLVTADEVGDIADDLISKQGEFDLQDVAGEAVIQRETALAKQLAIKKRATGILIDPVEYAVSVHDASLADFEPTMPWHSQPMSFKQEQMLNSYGFDVKLVTCKGHASAIIDRLMTRNHMNLASPKQVRVLQRYGVKKPEQWTRKAASEFLDKAFNKK
jgi:superfamily II DNA or RNA helicase